MAFDLQTQLSKFLADLYAGTLGVNQPLTAITVLGPGTGVILTNGSTSVLNVSGTITTTGAVNAGTSVFCGNTSSFGSTSRGIFSWSADGLLCASNAAFTIGSIVKTDALPTVSSGFGTSPSITAGSTPWAGSVNVGTGGAATSGVINFNGTAFPNATPFVVATTSLTNAVTRAVATATQLTLSSTTAWTASDIVSWVCISARA